MRHSRPLRTKIVRNALFLPAWVSSDRKHDGCLNEGSPEELVGVAFVLASKEVHSRRDELIQTQLTVVVRVDRLERVSRHLRIESDDVEEQFELVLLDHAVRVGVDGAEEQRQWTGKGLPHGGVLHPLLQSCDERLLTERLSPGAVFQVLLPDL